ncbi:hypothetical protein MAXJ12_29767 [Mesorhizobium alhagi CCNWXJ12-2]|uniref:Uncharacterized protein n=1 Tax=Mesorhizobium alhagi CCNWXJ12-2 TaxID=1107882 RepID=H0I0G6_9HYPH|nr:hypothetical protein MAXJ12_29767 [Mesorhizobium alhagi CCNWXJ12-2]
MSRTEGRAEESNDCRPLTNAIGDNSLVPFVAMRDEITDLSYRLPTIIFVAGEQEQMIEVVWPN